MLPWDRGQRQNLIATKKQHTWRSRVFYDLLLYRPTVTWNLFVLQVVNGVVMYVFVLLSGSFDPIKLRVRSSLNVCDRSNCDSLVFSSFILALIQLSISVSFRILHIFQLKNWFYDISRLRIEYSLLASFRSPSSIEENKL